jgi:branched-chain amino acid transport system permease protein
MYSFPILLQFLVSGIAVGCIYGLAGVGLVGIYSASRVINFAQGSFVMLGGMLTYMFYELLHIPLIIAALCSVISVALCGVILDVLFIRRLRHRNAPLFNMVLATLAFGIILDNAVLHALGDRPHDFSFISNSKSIVFLRASLNANYLVIGGSCVVIVILLALLFRYSLVGKAMRASAINSEAASLLGISADRMIAYSFALSGALGAIGGILITPVQYTSYSISLFFALSGFVAAVLGGLGNFFGAFAGGLVLGIVQTIATVAFGDGMKEIVSLSFLILLLLVRPQGLFGSKGLAHH